MIAQLEGKISQKNLEGLIINVNGVGYEVFVSKTCFQKLPELGEGVALLIHTHITETSFVLFGFLDSSEKHLFKNLLSVSGIGPKLAMQVLSGLTSFELIQALIDENLAKLTGISGIGKKTAERLIVELKDKVFKMADTIKLDVTSFGKGHVSPGKTYDEALSALMNLGYQRNIAEQALGKVKHHAGARVEELLRVSLGELSKM
ncbi:MAG: Holliday junction DNA helicase RuvA [Deltaproteobacteria bacterium GWA2_45_12]|nr:MAG: Holliday junction DNA helicase RuvA [Deltaproteobacteria bacterium GWA2_45_12]